MRRTDRLIEIIQILRGGDLHRAQDLAQHFG
ncbi:MAG: transcriptional regulator, partial [Pseudomonadota bacterium]